MLTKMTVQAFVEELASSSPAPGGGSVSALSGSMAAGLLNMVLKLTLGREKFAAVEGELAPLAEKTEKLYARLVELVDVDTEAFNGVMAAFKMPKETDSEKAARSAKIQEAYKVAADVPMEVAGHCLEVLRLNPVIVEKGNPNSLSDAGVAGQMAYAALEGAIMNVKINIGSIKDEAYVSKAKSQCEAMLKEGASLRDKVSSYVAQNI